MDTEPPRRTTMSDPIRNDDLERDFEPLRVSLALGALLIGLLFAMY